MIITEIKKVGKGERYSIFIDGIFNGTLEAETMVREKLKTGEEISPERLTQIKLENGKLAAFSRALSYIEKGLRTEKQLRDYLREKGYLEESVDEAIGKLSEYGYIDDRLFAESYIRTYMQRKGKLKLKFELLTKGVEADVAEEALDDILEEDDSLETCRKLLKKYLKSREMDAKLRAKAYAHLAGKGFESDLISKVLNEVKDESWN